MINGVEELLVESEDLVISGDGRNLRVGTRSYALTKNQARAFLALYRAYRCGIAISGKDALRASESLAVRLVDVFKRGASGPQLWKELIAPGPARGTYTLRLSDPLARPKSEIDPLTPHENDHARHR